MKKQQRSGKEKSISLSRTGLQIADSSLTSLSKDNRHYISSKRMLQEKNF